MLSKCCCDGWLLAAKIRIWWIIRSMTHDADRRASASWSQHSSTVSHSAAMPWEQTKARLVFLELTGRLRWQETVAYRMLSPWYRAMRSFLFVHDTFLHILQRRMKAHLRLERQPVFRNRTLDKQSDIDDSPAQQNITHKVITINFKDWISHLLSSTFPQGTQNLTQVNLHIRKYRILPSIVRTFLSQFWS